MTRKNAAATVHGMSDETWKRHANPWSVWTRLAAIPAFELAVWSRQWLGWWCLAAVLIVVVWLWLNVHLFQPVEPTSWAAKGIYGEQLHVDGKVPAEHKTTLNWLIASGLVGFALIAWGLTALTIWPLALGTVVAVLAQLWRIDRYGLLFQQHLHEQSRGDTAQPQPSGGAPSPHCCDFSRTSMRPQASGHKPLPEPVDERCGLKRT